MSTDLGVIAKFAMRISCMLILVFFIPVLMQMQLLQYALHKSALLVISITKGYVLPGRCADLKKKLNKQKIIFFYTLYQCVPFKDAFHSGHPHPTRRQVCWIENARHIKSPTGLGRGRGRGFHNTKNNYLVFYLFSMGPRVIGDPKSGIYFIIFFN